jgi:RNA polymerase sigma factor (sigma-70 family)
MDPSQKNDTQIWKRISKGDIKSFEFIYETYSEDLFRYGQKLTLNREFIEDSIHDTFLYVWENKEILEIRSSLKFYFIKIFKRKLFKKLKELKCSSSFEVNGEPWEDSIQELLLEKQIILESNKNVRSAINNLSDRQREAIFLRYIEGLSYEQVANLMDMKVESLYNLISKSLKNLGEMLSDKQTYIKTLPLLLLLLV